jgi:hypothetical protein
LKIVHIWLRASFVDACQTIRAENTIVEILDKAYPLVLHTDASRTFSTVRRMKAEEAMGLPINLRSGSAISVETGKAERRLWKRLPDRGRDRIQEAEFRRPGGVDGEVRFQAIPISGFNSQT